MSFLEPPKTKIVEKLIKISQNGPMIVYQNKKSDIKCIIIVKAFPNSHKN